MRALAAIGAMLAVLALGLGGAAPFGRVLMAAGLPGPAAALFEDPGWRGAALYRAGDFDGAAEAFGAARDRLGLGNAEVHRRNYAAALEAFDVAAAGGDAAAQANFDLVAGFYAGLAIDPDSLVLFAERKEGPQAASFIARGDARAAGTGDAVTNSSTTIGMAELISTGRLSVRQVFDDTFMAADSRWLAQLDDIPGAYLDARIAAERKRRAALGLAPPAPEDPR